MRTYLMGQLRALGYDAKLNDCGKAVNVIAGDPERASILYAAHYDTPLREPLPGDPLPDAAGDLSALSGAHARAGAGALLRGLPRRDLRAEPSEPDAAALSRAADRRVLAYLKYGPRRRRTMSTPTPPAWRRCSAPPSSSRRATATTSVFLFSGRRQRQYAGRQGLPQALSERQGEARPLPRLRGQRGRAADPAGPRAPAGTASCSTRSIRALRTPSARPATIRWTVSCISPATSAPSSRASRSARCAASPASGVSSARRGRIPASTMKI